MSHWELGELQHLSRSADHLGSLANVLKDLGGDETILHELTQNADDAEGATKIRFSVGDEALTVWNDGVFSNCGHQERKQCPWRSERGRSCDLHSFRLFSGRHKSGDASTTGAFGVGFTCVYHLTDHPELLTAGTHLLLDEQAAEEHRIRVCKAETCPRDHKAAGTTFLLPWARSLSPLRAELEVETIDDARIARLYATFLREASATLLFLKRVAAIEVVSGSEVFTASREFDDDVVRIMAEDHLEEWLLLEGEYDTSIELKRRYREIAPNRNPLVQVAINCGETIPGHFYAGLPSQMPTGWSGHINGSFYPRTDRKSFEFADGTYRSEWNLDLLDSAAYLVAQNLERIAEMAGVPASWRILRDLQQMSRDVTNGKQPKGFEQFYSKVAEAAVQSEILRVVDGNLTVPAGALLPMDVTHYEGAHVVHKMGLSVVHPDIRSLVFETEYTKYGINQLTARRLVEHLVGEGQLTEVWTAEESILKDEEVDSLLKLLELLLDRSASWREEAETSEIALIPCSGGRYAPARDAVLIEDEGLRQLFIRIDPDLYIVESKRLATTSPTMLGLVDELDLITGLHSLGNSPDPDLLSENAGLLIAWLEANRSSLESDETACDLVRALQVFPNSSGGYDSLENLSVPSNFEDLFGVADLVDADFAQCHSSLLQAVGAEQLSAVEYLTKHLLPCLPELAPDAQDLEFMLDLVYSARPTLGEEDRTTQRLRAAPLVTCTDGIARPGSRVHMPNAVVTLINPATPIADLAAISDYLHDTVIWLGASTSPSDFLVSEAARRLAEDDSAEPSPEVCAAILEAIRDMPSEYALVPANLANLRDLAWLPVEGGAKGRPSDVFPLFQIYLFESQGPKLGLPRDSQIQHSEALNWLGMPTEPTTPMVVAHLQHCAATGQPMNNEVYVWLGRHAESTAVKSLAEFPVIQTSPGVFAHARQTFWQPTQLGRWASELPHEMRRYQGFMDAIGVGERPTAGDLDFILKQIARDVGTNPLEAEDELVVRECWSMLDDLLNADPDTARMLQIIGRRACFPDPRGILAKPEHLIFRDPRKLADQIPLIANDVIDRERRTQHALGCAGVTKAENVITVEPVDVVSTRDEHLAAIVSERHIALSRAVESVSTARPELDIRSELIPELDFHRATTLRVKYRAAVGSQQFATPPQSIDAMFFADELRIVHTSTSTNIPVAREISRAIAPILDPSELAPLIVTVLDACSAEDATSRLDDYGVASVVDVDRRTVASRIAVDVWEDREEANQSDDEKSASAPEPHALDDVPEGGLPLAITAGDPADDLEDQDARVEALRQDAGERPANTLLSGTGSGKSSLPGTAGAPRPDRSPASSEATADRRSGRAAGTASRMRSYVLVGDDSAYGVTGDESHDALEIDRAGINRVLAYENANGREPEEQDHTNPGFDILSHATDGKILRRIEVKSIRGAWTIRGVMMSARQFREATEYGQQFWLYIVENAQDDDLYRIHRIQDPANRIDFFGFDNGWEALREPDIELADQARPPAARSTRALLGGSRSGQNSLSDGR